MNVASPLPLIAKESSQKVAVIAPRRFLFFKRTFDSITFKELEERSNYFASYFLQEGLKPGDLVLVFIKPSTSFSVVTFALFKAGLVPVFLDPGMGRKNLLRAIEHTKAKGLIGEPLVLKLKKIFRKSFTSIKYTYNISKLKKITFSQEPVPCMYEGKSDETAAILFTSGGTGVPKGVVYTHNIFIAQRQMLQELFSLTANDRDLPGFPLFGLFSLTMGMTSILPELNPTKPAKVNPKKVVQNILDHSPSFVAGSPAIWWRLLEYCEKMNIQLRSINSLVMFGAPVSLEMHKRWQKIIPNGHTYTPYGATESLPVTCISGQEILENFADKTNQGHGTCIGRAVLGVNILIAPITDNAIEVIGKEQWQQSGSLGEICVCSEAVTPEYINMPEKTKLAKMKDHEGRLWHRMGDLGYIDSDGLLWFCGRKTHRLELDQIIPSIPLENMINNLREVERCALIAPYNKPTLLIQNKKNSRPKESIIKELFIKSSYKVTLDRIVYVKSFPVDGRHNIKIDRSLLKKQYEITK